MVAMASSTTSAASATIAPAAGNLCHQELLRAPAQLSFPLSGCSRGSFVLSSSPKQRMRTSLNVTPVRATASTAQESEQAASSEKKPTKYHFLVANAKFMLDEEEHFQELMRERLRNFGERNREQDFWLVIEPKFLDKFPEICKRLGRPAVALVSTDELWITFMKLRLDRVLRGEFEADSMVEALKSNPVDLKFEKPQTWTAPYPKYTGPWWTPFLPPQEQ